jgi:type II secretory pathway component GspD/PulD (secretin)
MAAGIFHRSTVLLLLIAFACRTDAADPQFLGGLATLSDSNLAKQLELTDQQKQALEALVEKREQAVVGLVQEIKDLEPAQQAAKIRPFRAQSERLGEKILNPIQQKTWRTMRLRSQGLAALGRADVIVRLKISDDQQAKISQLLNAREVALASAGAAQAKLLRRDFERRLSRVLTDPQREAWEKLSAERHRIAVKVAATKVDATTKAATAKRPASPKKKIVGDGKLRFNFRYAPWRTVLEWFAEQADLSLVADSPPQGTFNYRDQRRYSPTEAIDLLNGVLITKGYTLVRRQRMLMLINLEDGVPPNLVQAVKPEDLDSKGEFELVRVLFALKTVKPEQVESEIESLLGPQGSVAVLGQARQIQVTEIAGRLRTIRDVIAAMEAPAAAKKGLHTFTLKHMLADEALVIVRQLLDLEEDANRTEDGSLLMAVDGLGTKILATGTPEKIKRLKEIIEVVDVPAGVVGDGGVIETPQLEVYSITAADPASVLQVMQTLMAGLPDVRLAIDPKSGHLVALARPSQHATIRATLDQMQRDGRKIEVIRLRSVDPQLAVLSINKLFGGDGEGASTGAPKVDAEPISRQLLIRGTETQIAQIRELLEKMGETGSSDVAGESRGNVRMVPLTGRAARSALEQIQQIWPTLRRNKIRVVTPSSVISTLRSSDNFRDPPRGVVPKRPQPKPETPEKELPKKKPLKKETPKKETPPAKSPKSADKSNPTRSPFRLVSQLDGDPAKKKPNKKSAAKKGSGAPIIVAPGPSGIMIASEDVEALTEFEDLLMTLSSQAATGTQFTVFYLKYARASVVAELLNTILGGSGASSAGGGGSLLGDLAKSALGGSGGGLVGGLLGLGGGGGGDLLGLGGGLSIVAEERLNALVVQGSADDLDTIEQLLKVIDQKTSPEDVQVSSKPRLIPLYNTGAEEIRSVVSQVYQDRMLVTASGGARQQPSPEQFIRMLRGGRGNQRSAAKNTDAQKMKLSIDARTNSLIVIAPDPLFEEVEFLVRQLDQPNVENSERIRVVKLRGANPEVVYRALAAIVGDSLKSTGNQKSGMSPKASSNNGSTAPKTTSPRAAPGANRSEEIRRRIEAFRRSQGGGGEGRRGGGARGGGSRGGGRPERSRGR